MSKKNQRSLVRKFITVFTLLSSLIIVLFSLYIHFLLNEKYKKSNTTLKKNNILQAEKIALTLVDSIKSKNSQINSVIGRLKKIDLKKNGIYGIYIYSPTVDDDYFKIKSTIVYDRSLKNYIKRNNIVKINSDEKNFLKSARYETTTDSKIYSHGNLSWFNIFTPFQLKSKSGRNLNYIVQLSISDNGTVLQIDKNRKEIKRYKLYLVISLAIAIFIYYIIISIYGYKLTGIFKNLTSFVKRAEAGDLDMSLNQNADKDISEFALSFNSIIEELKEFRAKDLEDQSKDNYSFTEIFKTGVAYLHDKNYIRALHLFEALSTLKTESFGCFFNLGITYAKLKLFDKSISSFNRALEIKPQDQKAASYIEKVNKLKDACSNDEKEKSTE